jgi:hypothetical protein
MTTDDQNAPCSAEPIYAYTPEDAVEDQLQVHFNPATALEAGYAIPVLMMRAAFKDAVQWTRPDGWQSINARLWDVLTMARGAAKAASSDGNTQLFRVARVPNLTPSGTLSRSETAATIELEVRAEGFNAAGDPCLIISEPNED